MAQSAFQITQLPNYTITQFFVWRYGKLRSLAQDSLAGRWGWRSGRRSLRGGLLGAIAKGYLIARRCAGRLTQGLRIRGTLCMGARWWCWRLRCWRFAI